MKKTICLFFGGFIFFVIGAFAQEKIVDFESGQWVSTNAKIKEHLCRKSLVGLAYLRDIQLENGIIEVDVAVTGKRSYPGIIFRMQSLKNYERFYIRPHRASLYPDALQYVPVFNGIAGWQLYNGKGYTAGAEIPTNQWVHLKMEIQGKQARVYLGDQKQPALVITDFKHGVSKGAVGLMGPKDNTAYFSNFKYKIDNTLKFPPAPEIETPPGMITQWQLSQPFKVSQVNKERPPGNEVLTGIKWQNIRSEPSGLVDIARFVGRTGGEADCVFAKTTINSSEDVKKRYQFGYSDVLSIVFNREILFTGNSAYQLRDPSFLGIIGVNDSVYLPLQKGKNELLLIVGESFGGWGFIFQDGNAVFLHENLTPLWELPRKLKFPESVVYDKKRDVLYVSNFFNSGKEFLSKVRLNGEIEKLQWITGLNRPTGMAIFNDKLYVVDRANLVEINIEAGKIANKHPVPGAKFINDVDFDAAGSAYISDLNGNAIYKFSRGKFEVWLQGEEIPAPNGMCVDNDKLIIGTIGDGSLKSANLSDKKMTTIISFGSGTVMDGLRKDGKGNYIISDYSGRVFLVTPAGQKTKLLDTTVPKKFCADLEYIIEKKLLIIPTLYDNRIMAFKIK